MQYPVPQFIEVESKIIGPLSLKQFLYLVGGVAICVILNFFLKLGAVIILGIFIMGFVGALAFLKINGQPFSKILKSMIQFSFGPRIYVWKKTKTTNQH